MLNIDTPDPDLNKVEFPPDFLSKIYLARCSLDFKKTCSTPEGQISDFNIWKKPLSTKEMMDFTTCRFVQNWVLLKNYHFSPFQRVKKGEMVFSMPLQNCTVSLRVI